MRIGADMRRLNKDVPHPPVYPLPRCDDLLGQVGRLKPRYLGKLDAKQAYYQMPIREEDVAKTAFRSHRRHYEFLRLPMGCNVSAQLFQKLMNTMLRGLEDVVFVYLDNILIATNTFEQYLETLETV
ncbi:MAG: RNA-directed DNA polymerase, partial [Desulfobacteraceae bacterium]|nr:RNA-directed DNA polymerase [Desulfobacteraceae bacterium]